MATLDGVVQSPDQPCKGFDTDTVVSAATATAFFNQGYRFCVRYLSLGAECAGDLSYDEACAILSAGLALMPVQHVRAAGWEPSAALGSQYGGEAAGNAQRVGFPGGVNIWCDLEGIASSAAVSDVIAYCNAWYAAVCAEYVPGLYVGACSPLTGEQLDELPFQHYWKSESNVPMVATRGYQMVQAPESAPINNLSIDLDATQADNLGGQVLWLKA